LNPKSFIDLLTAQKGIKRATSGWEYIYYSKIGYRIIYETINTFHKHKKDLRETIDNDQKELIKHFILLNDLLKAYKYSYDFDKTMSKIRNKTIAHFDKDYFEYYKYF